MACTFSYVWKRWIRFIHILLSVLCIYLWIWTNTSLFSLLCLALFYQPIWFCAPWCSHFFYRDHLFHGHGDLSLSSSLSQGQAKIKKDAHETNFLRQLHIYRTAATLSILFILPQSLVLSDRSSLNILLPLFDNWSCFHLLLQTQNVLLLMKNLFE